MTATIHYNEAILKAAIGWYIKCYYLKYLFWPSALAVALLFFALSTPSPWLQAFIIVTVLLVPTAIILAYWMRIKQSLRILQLLDDGRVDLTIAEDGLTSTSAMGHSHLKWKMFSGVWHTPKASLILYTNNHFMTLPHDQVPAAFIEEIGKRLKDYQTNTKKV